MSATLKQGLTEEVVRDLSAARDEPDWLLERRLDALDALDDLDLPDVIQTPGRRWTNLTDLQFEQLVDPLNQSDETERVTAEGVEVLDFETALDETRSSSARSSARRSTRRRTTSPRCRRRCSPPAR